MMPLVLVHGFMGGSDQWALQRQGLSDNFDIVTVDLPGFGENAALEPPDSITGHASWVLEELTRRGIERFHLLGHSMGGMIVQEMMALAPERVDRLVLYGTGAAGGLPGRFEPISTSKERAIAEGPQSTARRIAATWFLERDAAKAYPDCAAIAERSSLQAIVAGLESMQAWNGVAHLPHIEAPTLVIWGDHDRTYCWDQTRQLWGSIEKARLAVVPGCAHAVHLEKPAIFNAIVSDFLEGSSAVA